jgi:hypothetical protein
MSSCDCTNLLDDDVTHYVSSLEDEILESWRRYSSVGNPEYGKALDLDETRLAIEDFGSYREAFIRDKIRVRIPDMHKKAFEAALNISNYKDEFVKDSLPDILKEETGKKRLLLLATTAVGMDWLGKDILDSIGLDECCLDLYLLFRKYLCCNHSKADIKTKIKDLIVKTNYEDMHHGFRLLLLYIKEKGNLNDIRTIQSKFNIIKRNNVRLFMNEELIFALETLLTTDLGSLFDNLGNEDMHLYTNIYYSNTKVLSIGSLLNEFEWEDRDIELLIRGYYINTLRKVPLDKLLGVVTRMLQEEGSMLCRIPTIDLIMKSEAPNGDEFIRAMDKECIEFITLVNDQDYSAGFIRKLFIGDRASSLRRFFADNETYLYNEALLRWIIMDRRWSVLDVIINQVKRDNINDMVILDDGLFSYMAKYNNIASLIDTGCFKLNVSISNTKRLLRKLSSESFDSGILITKCDIEILELACRNESLKCVVEQMRNMTSEKYEFDYYVASKRPRGSFGDEDGYRV